MTTLATVLIVATLLVAAADWWAVSADRRSVEYVLKPLTMVVLIAAVLAMEPTSEDARLFIVAGLVCSLVGDVFLMLDQKYFLGGLVSFLVGHVMYVIGLLQFDVEPPLLMVGVLLVLIAAAVVGSKVVAGARGQDERLTVPVAVYLSIISLMVVTAFGTALPVAIAGALLFYASDGVLGYNRFVQPIPHGRLLIMTTYHLGQIGLALALVA